MKTMTTSNLPQKCWIFEKGQYILKSVMLPELPYVDLEYEPILKSNGIPYRKTSKDFYFPNPKEFLEYWNPEVGIEEKELTLPLFAKMPDGSYKYCEKKYSQNILTDETLEAARETEKFVEQEVDDYDQILREVQHYKFAKEKLADGVAVVCISRDTPYDSIYEINMNHEMFTILRPYDSIYLSNWVAIFNMNKVAKNGYLTLQVPKHVAGVFIGKNASTLHAWAEEIGVKKIQVIPI